MTDTHLDMHLARDGGPRARTRPEHPMFPGGMEINDEELEAVTRVIRSKNRDTGRNTSLTLMSWPAGFSSCCNTGSATRVAKMSPGSSSTGNRLMVASAAPVTMFVAPGPIEEVQASVDIRFRVRANATAACTMACSLRPCRYFSPPS